ncbi:hypothetical protein RJP82_27470 [Escherichia coli]|nr:hypothetical protein [Escherichia coli]MDS1185639.1 hypothetical protein [Escherichia coli]
MAFCNTTRRLAKMQWRNF